MVSPKKERAKSEEFLVLGRDYLGPRETFAPPPPNFKVVPVPLDRFSTEEDAPDLTVNQSPLGTSAISTW